MASFEKSIAKIEKNESYSDKVYRLLKQLIISGQIGPGTVINERSFSNILDVSRTPLRDALKILESEGWIEQRGSQRVVAPLRWKDLCDLMEIREKLELMCFELAVPRTTEHDITYLQAILGSMKEQNRTDPSDLYAVMKADTEFHRYIAYISGNRLLLELQNLIYEKIIRSSVLSMRINKANAEIFAGDHEVFIEALKERDFGKAAEAAHIHCENWKKRLLLLPGLLHFDPEDMEYVIEEKFVRNGEEVL